MISHDIHVHTNLSKCSSDKEAIPERYIDYAKKLGIKVIGFSDHFWDSLVEGASDWYRSQDFDHIMQINKMLPKEIDGIKVMVGCETEYCGDGKIGIDPSTAKKLDFVLVPISHVHMKGFVEPEWVTTPEDVAKLMVGYFKDVLEFDFITGIAHPFYPLGYDNVDEILSYISNEEFKECFDMAAKKGVSIELNSCHFPSIKGRETSMHSDKSFANMFSIAKDMGCKFHYGSDAHSLEALGRIVKFRKIAEDLGITDDDIHPIARG